MKNIKLTFCIAFLFLPLLCGAQVKFSFDARSAPTGAVKATMEKNLSALLTEIDRAGSGGSNLNLNGISIESGVQEQTDGAKEHLQYLWEVCPFVCKKTSYVGKCINDHQGYQVRGIAITMKPKDSSYDGSLDRELTVSFNKNGMITGVRPAYELQEDARKFFQEGGVADVAQRMEILKWVEDFRCYYNERNLNALNQIYSEDALIITGSVVKKRTRTGDGVQYKNKVKYTKQTKSEYLDKLARMFRNKKYIDVKFDHITVMRHGAKPNIYGVTLHQVWKTSGYEDEGWLFLLWDFNNPDRPEIHVRTWQTDQVVAEDGVFSLDDFFIP